MKNSERTLFRMLQDDMVDIVTIRRVRNQTTVHNGRHWAPRKVCWFVQFSCTTTTSARLRDTNILIVTCDVPHDFSKPTTKIEIESIECNTYRRFHLFNAVVTNDCVYLDMHSFHSDMWCLFDPSTGGKSP